MIDAPDEGRARDALARADRAKRLLEDELFIEAFDAVDSALRQGWAATRGDQSEDRERLWLMLKLLERVRGHVSAVVHGGKLAGVRLAEIEKRRADTVARARRMGAA